MPCESLNPTCSHVSPASRLRYTPSPGRMFPRIQVSPVPMKIRSGLVSLTSTAPTEDELILKSVIEFQSSPPLLVFHKPPPTAPK